MKRTITYMDPFGGEDRRRDLILNNWEKFCENWNSTEKKGPKRGRLPTDYRIVTPPHTLQQRGDGRSCGIYVCLVCVLLTLLHSAVVNSQSVVFKSQLYLSRTEFGKHVITIELDLSFSSHVIGLVALQCQQQL